MQINSYDELLNDNLDILKEIGNIGMGHASTALSQMLSMKVTMTIPEVYALTPESAVEFLTPLKSTCFAVRLGLQGNSNGTILQILSKDFAMRVINFFFGFNLEEIEDLDEMGLSVIQEIGNITSGAYCNSLASMTGLFIDISTPSYCPDFDVVLLEKDDNGKYKCGEQFLLINNNFFIGIDEISSHFLFIPDTSTIENILHKLKEYYGFIE